MQKTSQKWLCKNSVSTEQIESFWFKQNNTFLLIFHGLLKKIKNFLLKFTGYLWTYIFFCKFSSPDSNKMHLVNLARQETIKHLKQTSMHVWIVAKYFTTS